MCVCVHMQNTDIHDATKYIPTLFNYALVQHISTLYKVITLSYLSVHTRTSQLIVVFIFIVICISPDPSKFAVS